MPASPGSAVAAEESVDVGCGKTSRHAQQRPALGVHPRSETRRTPSPTRGRERSRPGSRRPAGRIATRASQITTATATCELGKRGPSTPPARVPSERGSGRNAQRRGVQMGGVIPRSATGYRMKPDVAHVERARTVASTYRNSRRRPVKIERAAEQGQQSVVRDVVKCRYSSTATRAARCRSAAPGGA